LQSHTIFPLTVTILHSPPFMQGSWTQPTSRNQRSNQRSNQRYKLFKWICPF